MKDLKISNLLLSEVLGHDDICNERIIQNKLLYMRKNDGMIDYEYEYNIYEFAFKCKEWIVTQGYGIKTETYDYMEDDSYSGIYWYIIKLRAKNYKDKGCPNCGANATEIEAVVKACNWILEKEIQEEHNLQLQEDLTEYNKLVMEGL